MIRLHHVQVVVLPGRTEAVVGFYTALGMTRVVKPAGVSTVGAWFDLPGATTQVHVSERGGERHPEQHFALSVVDLDTLIVTLTEAGHPYAAKSSVLGARRGQTQDPEGNVVELIEAVGPFA